jgi:hypothetical protein
MIVVNKALSRPEKKLSPIKFQVRYHGELYTYYPSVTVETKFWVKEKQICRVCRGYPDASRINTVLSNHERLMQDAFRFFDKDQIIPTKQMVREWIWNKLSGISVSANGLPVKKGRKLKKEDPESQVGSLIEYATKYKNECDRKMGTKKSYESTISCLARFEKETGKVNAFSDIDANFYKSLRAFLKTTTAKIT